MHRGEGVSSGLIDRLRPAWRPVACIMLGGLAVACGGDSGPRLTIVGTCDPLGGELTADAEGFTPGADYETTGQYPDGTEYTAIENPGRVDEDGTLPDWGWPCADGDPEGPAGPGCGDPPGEYTVRVTDDAGRSAEASFTIDPPENYEGACVYAPLGSLGETNGAS